MSGRPFRLVCDHRPKGDQPRAIEQLAEGLCRGDRHQVLLGVTGSGKTFTMANVIARLQRPALVIAHNKTLAAQLYSEFRELFPDNAVEYFVSYYDYYQPESYLPSRDLYIEKDAEVNERIDKLRHAATRSLCERRDVIVVASVSCIYGIGAPETYSRMHASLRRGMTMDRDEFLMRLTEIQYARNNFDFRRKTFRVNGDVVDVFPAHEEARAIRIEFFGDEVEALYEFDPLTGERFSELEEAHVFPSSHYVTARDQMKTAVQAIEGELAERLDFFEKQNKVVESQRLRQRTLYDLELLREIGFCKGIENYSRHLSGRAPGEPPPTLVDYFPRDFITFVDESHQTIPQLQGMCRGDFARKSTLVAYGFRLPSAIDNRPLRYEEFQAAVGQVVYASATPGPNELKLTGGAVVEQVIRPTGLIDPPVEVRPASAQVDDLMAEIRRTTAEGHRVLVTTLTKRMAEELTEYLEENGVKVTYLHSEIETIERTEIIRDLRKGIFDVLVGINLLREGLDMPEVALVAVLDADKEGFLRSATSLIQTCGRAARNLQGRVILYADKTTNSIRETIDETSRRRVLQEEYNRQNHITAESVKKGIKDLLESACEADDVTVSSAGRTRAGGRGRKTAKAGDAAGIRKERIRLEKEMLKAAKALKFELAAEIRDRIFELEDKELGFAP